MTFKTILVHCDGDKALAQRLNVATDLATKFASHLVGLHVRALFQPPTFYDGSFVIDELYKIYEENRDADQASAFSAFAKATEGGNLAVERHAEDGLVDVQITKHARYADLVVVGQSGKETPAATPLDLPEVVAMSAGRPVLVVPYIDVKKPIGETVILCWNASREAARAAADALPILKAAEKVIVLAFRAKDASEDTGAADAATWLATHGVKATVREEVAADADVADLILSQAADLDADLIVMGIYGHTRVREMVLGGVSRTLLRSMTVPLLMSH